MKKRGLKPGTAFRRYTVYRNKDDKLMILDGTARECAAVMGITLGSFQSAVTRCKNGTNNRWYIESNPIEK